MANVVVVGAQWGDEGKGKIVDWLCERADVIARFQGGHNAGHTLVIDGKVYKLSLLPSGIVRPGKLSVIGNGVVLDPWALLAEIDKLRGQGVAIGPDNLMIAENTPLILPLHQELDRCARRPPARRRSAPPGAASARPTRTRSAAARSAWATSATRRRWRPGSTGCWRTTTRCAAASAPSRSTAPSCRRGCSRSRRRVLPFAAPVWRVLTRRRARGKRILFEGAQGALLDVDFGTYPYVTSSNTLAGRPPPAPAWAPGRSTSCSASSRPTPPASARARSRPS